MLVRRKFADGISERKAFSYADYGASLDIYEAEGTLKVDRESVFRS